MSAALTLAMAAPAHAEDNDFVLARLGTVVGNGANTDVVGDNPAFRSMISELGVVLAPRLLSPSDTIGFGGFQFSADIGYTSITNDAAYWRALESSPDPGGTMDGVDHGSGLLPTVGVFMRKGIWLPLPSFEVGAGVVHLLDSNLWAGQAYAKFALHEGYHGLPLPSLAVRGAGSRMMGSRDLDLTIASVDISLSKEFGVSGSVQLAPYAGWNALIIVPRSEVVDKSPDVAGDNELNFVFKEQDDIVRNRIFGGLKVQYYVFAFTFEAAFALAGSSVDDRLNTDMDCALATAPTDFCDSTDAAGAQQTYSISVGMDF